MDKLFGTDGIRGKANSYPITPELILNIARAASHFFYINKSIENRKVIIARDTRASCEMIESALAAGFTSMGLNVEKAGVLPTPGLAYITANSEADFSVMISASHNPYFDNGIKFFKGNGKKLKDKDQDEITSIYYSQEYLSENHEPGRIKDIHESALENYKKLFRLYSGGKRILNDKKIVLDTANGACFEIASDVFKELGADIIQISGNPDGFNINRDCGSEHTDKISKRVVDEKADFGLSFDGDGDRLIAIDDKGERITGDQILAIVSEISNSGEKKVETIVSTIMSNLGLRLFFKEKGINHIQAQVGDRYVYQEMIENNAKIGGEDSGHLIFLDYQNTGDGILSGIILSNLIIKSGKKLSELKKIIKIFPQKLVNIEVKEKPPLEGISEIHNAIKTIETKLGDKGRVLVRYSGTQNMCRVMVEAETDNLTSEACDFISKSVVKTIGA